jgi:hypothetical protein
MFGTSTQLLPISSLLYTTNPMKLLALILLAESLFYRQTTVQKLAAGKCKMTRAVLTGKVEYVKREDDGDIHIRVGDGKYFIVAECMPAIPCVRPKVGDRVSVEGITRYDAEHGWFELHPVTHLEVLP